MPSLAIEVVGGIAAFLTTIAYVPQALKTLRSRQTRDISLVTHATLLAGILLWLLYGLLIGSWPLIGANLVTMVLISSILTMKLRFG